MYIIVQKKVFKISLVWSFSTVFPPGTGNSSQGLEYARQTLYHKATLLWGIQAGSQNTKAFQETIFISVPAVAQWIPIQRLSPKNKRSYLIYPCKQVTEARSKA
jgi:hypothetical protein